MRVALTKDVEMVVLLGGREGVVGLEAMQAPGAAAHEEPSPRLAIESPGEGL